MVEKRVTIDKQDYLFRAHSSDLIDFALHQMVKNFSCIYMFPGEVIEVDISRARNPVARFSIHRGEKVSVPCLGFMLHKKGWFYPCDELRRTADYILRYHKLGDLVVPTYNFHLDSRAVSMPGGVSDLHIDLIIMKEPERKLSHIVSTLSTHVEHDPEEWHARNVLESLYLSFGVAYKRFEDEDCRLIQQKSISLLEMIKANDTFSPKPPLGRRTIPVPKYDKLLFIDNYREVMSFADEYLEHCLVEGSERAFSRHFEFTNVDNTDPEYWR